VLIDAIEREAALTAIGIMAHEAQLHGYLCERLRIEDWYRPPSRDRRRADRRTDLRDRSAAHRHDGSVDTSSPRIPTPARSPCGSRSRRRPPPERATYATDPRIAASDARNAPMRADADFVRMYDGTAISPTENIDLLGQHFRTQHFEGMAHVPSYIRWWLACDMVPAYRHHERVLKLLQWRCPPTRWHLKSPPISAASTRSSRCIPRPASSGRIATRRRFSPRCAS
jgi:hypothetical protein